jgi:hypothetical protein
MQPGRTFPRRVYRGWLVKIACDVLLGCDDLKRRTRDLIIFPRWRGAATKLDSQPASQPQLAAVAAMATTTKRTMPDPVLPELQTEGILEYRMAYRRFRSGAERGARGEVTGATSPVAGDQEQFWDWEEDDELFDEEDDSSRMPLINAFRMAYRAYRSGSAHGARGEVGKLSSFMTYRESLALPVSQLYLVARFSKSDPLPASAPSRFHIHFGAGRLGLGLCIPALHASGRPYAILQRPSSAWSPVLNSKESLVHLEINGKPSVLGMQRMTNDTEPSDVMNILDVDERSERKDNCRVFACLDEERIVTPLINFATSFSTSLGPALLPMLRPLLLTLPKVDPTEGVRPVLFACENDHKAVDQLAALLEGRVDVVNCMVDRICTSRDIGDGVIRVGAEPYDGELVVIDAPKYSPAAPFSGKHVRIPVLKSHAEYLCDRKITMVNGMHTCLAFLSLCKLEPGTGGLKGDSWKEHTLLTADSATEEERDRLWLWAVARILFLLYSHPTEVVKSCHGVDTDEEAAKILVDYARQTLARFSTVRWQTIHVS